MKLEKSDNSLLFSTTSIPDAFFTEYFPQASSDSIKVFLYLYFLSKYGKEIKINDLSKKLNLPLKAIQDSIKYWEGLGLLIRKNSGYEFANMQEIELHKLYNPKITQSVDQIKNTEKNQYRAKAIETINNEFFQGVMSPSWYGDIDLWFSKYSFDEEVMVSLFRYCFNRSALHRNYIQAVAEAWSQNNIKTYEDLDKYYAQQEALAKISKAIAKKLGLNRQLSQYEEAYIEKWVNDYGYDMKIIELALKKTTSKSNPNFDYINKILSDWHDRGLKTPEAIEKFLADMKQKNKDIKNIEKKAGYNNYSQRSYTNLSDLYANTPDSPN
ncbi:MAG: DnaD domain protein [Clostridia bacterium]